MLGFVNGILFTFCMNVKNEKAVWDYVINILNLFDKNNWKEIKTDLFYSGFTFWCSLENRFKYKHSIYKYKIILNDIRIKEIFTMSILQKKIGANIVNMKGRCVFIQNKLHFFNTHGKSVKT